MAVDAPTFLKQVTILRDTRERENGHILRTLDSLGVAHEARKLDFGDYSFVAGGRDFSLSCVIERKANIDELYGNLTRDRGRLEREFEAGSRLARDFILLLENCPSMEALRAHEVDEREMARLGRTQKKTGAHCCATIKSWQCGNRYGFRTLFVANPADTARAMLEEFYYVWRNYRLATARRVLPRAGRR